MKVESELTLVNIISQALVGKFVVITIGDCLLGMGEVKRVTLKNYRVDEAFCIEFKSGDSTLIHNPEYTIIKVMGDKK